MVYTPVLGTGAARRGGSSPLSPTKLRRLLQNSFFNLDRNMVTRKPERGQSEAGLMNFPAGKYQWPSPCLPAGGLSRPPRKKNELVSFFF